MYFFVLDCCGVVLFTLLPGRVSCGAQCGFECLRGFDALIFRNDAFCLQIIRGRLYVRFQTGNLKMPGVHTREGDGWFPGNEGPGEWTKGRC